jgi:hypothetical protein
MALSALNWRMLKPVALTPTMTINTLMDAMYTSMTAANYADGTARTAGSGSGWTWAKDTTKYAPRTTALIGTPPINALGMGYIIAGDSVGGAGPTALGAVDSMGTANLLYLAMSKNGGTYTDWTVAQPFGAGTYFSGFIRATMLLVASQFVTPTTVYMFESQEAFFCLLTRASDGACTMFMCGALIDPLSGAAANAESDGRLYTIANTSSGTVAGTTAFLGNGLSPFAGGTSANAGHQYTFNVGNVNTCRDTVKIGSFTANTSAFTAPNGEFPNVPFSAYFAATGQFAGQYRQIGLTRATTPGSEVSVAGVVKGYAISGSSATVGPAVLLTY